MIKQDLKQQINLPYGFSYMRCPRCDHDKFKIVTSQKYFNLECEQCSQSSVPFSNYDMWIEYE